MQAHIPASAAPYRALQCHLLLGSLVQAIHHLRRGPVQLQPLVHCLRVAAGPARPQEGQTCLQLGHQGAHVGAGLVAGVAQQH